MTRHGDGGEIKSAYEVALARLDRQGISPPRSDALTDQARARMAEIRQKAEASLAELEILHRDRLARIADPGKRQEEEDHYLHRRRAIEAGRDRSLERLRSAELDDQP